MSEKGRLTLVLLENAVSAHAAAFRCVNHYMPIGEDHD